MDAAKAFENGPIEYRDGAVDMRLTFVPVAQAVTLEWLSSNGDWVEVSSMRLVAFQAFLEKLKVV